MCVWVLLPCEDYIPFRVMPYPKSLYHSPYCLDFKEFVNSGNGGGGQEVGSCKKERKKNYNYYVAEDKCKGTFAFLSNPIFFNIM